MMKNIKDYINSIIQPDHINIHYSINDVDKTDNIENFTNKYNSIKVDKNGDCYNSNYQVILDMYIVRTSNY